MLKRNLKHGTAVPHGTSERLESMGLEELEEWCKVVAPKELGLKRCPRLPFFPEVWGLV